MTGTYKGVLVPAVGYSRVLLDPFACSDSWQFLAIESGMQESRYPMTGTKGTLLYPMTGRSEVLVPAVGYGRLFWIRICY